MSETMMAGIAVPEDVLAFARRKGVADYIPGVVEAARKNFPGRPAIAKKMAASKHGSTEPAWKRITSGRQNFLFAGRKSSREVLPEKPLRWRRWIDSKTG